VRKIACAVAICLMTITTTLSGQEAPVIPVGLDSYTMWDRWPYQRIGARAYMRSTYDRMGGNEGADASHFLYQLSDKENVTLDVAGPGVLYFARYNHWHGSPWHYTVDGTDHLVTETSTADPLHPVNGSAFEPAALFPQPLALTWAETNGADLSWVPIAFERSLRMAYTRTRYGSGYYIYDSYVGGTRLSRPLKSFDWKTPMDSTVLDLIRRSGEDRSAGLGNEEAGVVAVPASGTVPVWSASVARGMIRLVEFSVPRDEALAFSKVSLRVTWDGRKTPSVDAPMALFYGAGLLYNRDNKEYLVKAFPSVVKYVGDRVLMQCFFPMPFFKSARMELVGTGALPIGDVKWKVRVAPFKDAPNQVGYFHATHKDFVKQVPGQDMVLLDTTATEGGGDWTGLFVGTSFTFSDRAALSTLEGDPRFFFDDAETPQAQGTGTEEWGGGGDYWGGQTMTLPFAGHPVGAQNSRAAVSAEDRVESAYRFLLADAMPFGRNARIQLEHGAEDESTEHYETVTYWYGLPSASVVKTDELQMGDAASRKKHGYVSAEASAPYTLTSRFELGVDKVRTGGIAYAPTTDSGVKMKDTSEFTMKIEPRNLGVMLRRKLDYSFPNQKAEISVMARDGVWRSAGVWYTAGSNTVVYSNPLNELGTTEHVIETSNRRFRDDEFLIAKDLTNGRRSIRIRVKFLPVNVPLFPGRALDELAWSEIRYTAYSFLMPRFREP
jgi:hypothetical protein